MRVHVHVPPAVGDLPCFEAFIEASDIPHITFFGAGCSLRREVALIRALVEAVQSRLTYIAGSRDDLDHRKYAGDAMPDGSYAGPVWPTQREVIYQHVPERSPGTLREGVRAVAAAIAEHTEAAPVAVDLSRPETALPVVYVIAPGLRVNHYA
jgi:ribosomal protein S12 methylthiotransferase accessory factor